MGVDQGRSMGREGASPGMEHGQGASFELHATIYWARELMPIKTCVLVPIKGDTHTFNSI